ncbi:hypothetical protein GCM10022393_25770 [Aquimarina addita]|uniref:Tetratricopeptide repeat protein n=2 Tax=Aquimarina addita TaxID=870485 RepID=A0ABP6UPZ7_9FLAO
MLVSLLLLSACHQEESLYKREFTNKDSKIYARQFINGLNTHYYQGSPEEHFQILEAKKLDSTFADIYREMGASRVKRGLITQFYETYGKAVAYDAESWQGYRGYLYLYFYRDYDRAIQDYNTLDALTPDFVDYPQSENIDFSRAVCYLMKKEYDKALSYFEKFFEHEIEADNLDYVQSRAFLFHGITYYNMGNIERALEKIDLGIQHNKNADLLYWKAKIWKESGGKTSEIFQLLKESKKLMKQGSNNRRPYVEEFYQTYIEDIEEMIQSIS